MKSTKRIELDWSKLFGFNQVVSAKSDFEKSANSILGAKVGGKPVSPNIGAKIGAKIGTKVTSPIGAKVGLKPI